MFRVSAPPGKKKTDHHNDKRDEKKWQVFEHLSQPFVAMKQIYRLLAPGGQLAWFHWGFSCWVLYGFWGGWKSEVLSHEMFVI